MDYIRRGDVFYCNINPKGLLGEHVQKGLRPVVIVSNNINNRCCPTVNVVSISTKNHHLPQQAEIHSAMVDPSYAKCETITTVDKSWLLEYKTHLSKADMRMIDRAMAMQLGMDMER